MYNPNCLTEIMYNPFTLILNVPPKKNKPKASFYYQGEFSNREKGLIPIVWLKFTYPLVNCYTLPLKKWPMKSSLIYRT